MKTGILLFGFALLFSKDLSAQIESYENTEHEAFTYVEKMPQFADGQAEMYRFIYNNMQIPEEYKKQGIEGKVVVQFVIDTSGYVVRPKIVQNTTVDCGYDEVALSILEKMNEGGPHWVTGRHNGKPVPVTFTLPMKFTLSEK